MKGQDRYKPSENRGPVINYIVFKVMLMIPKHYCWKWRMKTILLIYRR